MAEQKTEDPKPPLARRGARPFAGPAGAPNAPRPFLRPATPGQRPAPAPFAPRGVAAGSPLGVPAPPAPAAPTSKPVQVGPAEQIEDSTPSVAPPAVSLPEPTGIPSAPVTLSDFAPAPASVRPITSEMVALDAIDAFDALWASAGEVASQSGGPDVENHSTTASLLDESSLGGLDAPSMWSGEITEAVEQTASTAEPLELTPPRTPVVLDMPAWLADDHDPTPIEAAAADPAPVSQHTVVPEPVAAGSTVDCGEAPTELATAPSVAPDGPIESDYPATSEPTWPDQRSAQAVEEGVPLVVEDRTPLVVDAMAVTETSSLGDDRPRFELVDEPASPEPSRADASVPESRGVHVSAALARLAERVRSGEIDVSSIAPEATDAAMLASVLVALLGGSSSR